MSALRLVMLDEQTWVHKDFLAAVDYCRAKKETEISRPERSGGLPRSGLQKFEALLELNLNQLTGPKDK